MSRSLKAHILLVLVSFIWGVNFVVIKNALADCSPLFFNAVRMVLAAALLMVFFYRDLPRLTWGAIGAGSLIGILLSLGNEFQTAGLQYTTPSKSAFLTGISVVLVPVFLALFWKRRINRWSTAGVCLAFLGLFLLTVPRTTAGVTLLHSMNRGDLLTLVAAAIYAFHIIFIAHVTQKYSWQQITLVQLVSSAIFSLITTPLAENVHVVWSGRVLWGVVITGCLSLAFCLSVQAWAQQFTPPTHTALIFTLEPVFAWMTSFLFLGERLGTRSVIGGLCILAGVLISEEKGSAESMGVSPDHAGVPASGSAQPGILGK